MTVLAAAMLAALLLAAPASALVKYRFSAPLQGGVNNAGLELDAYYKKSTPKYVTNLEWHNLTCPGGGYIPYFGVQHWTVDVNDGKFSKTHAVHNGGGAKVKITGKFSVKNGNKRLAGTFKLTNLTSCPSGTGKLAYKSK